MGNITKWIFLNLKKASQVMAKGNIISTFSLRFNVTSVAT